MSQEGLVLLFLASLSVVSADEIVDLPGLHFTPNFRHYSDYLQATETRFLHYWFVESQREPVNDPLIIWFNGGPGCSSLAGLLDEMGPYLVNEDGKSLRTNENAWNKFANVLYLETPTGTGFSYASDGNLTNDDDQTAAENYEAIKQFFKEFPEYRNRSIFLIGESYGGVHVPVLAGTIIDGQKDFHINFKGIALGNGYVNAKLVLKTQRQFAYNHGFYDELGWQKFVKECCNGCEEECPEDELSGNCETIHDKADLTLGINKYNIYADCIMDGYNPGLPCTKGAAMHHYLNDAMVRKALFIPSIAGDWELCSVYTHNSHTQLHYDVSSFVKKVIAEGIRVLLYYGDIDWICDFGLGQEFSARLGLPLVEGKTQWEFNGQVAGFKTTYEGLTFITVRGAGHMVCY